MLFRRQQKPPPTPPVVKTYNHRGETYEIVQWPDHGRAAVSAHGRTYYVQPEKPDAHGHSSYQIAKIVEYSYRPLYPPIPITRRAEAVVGWAKSPEAAVAECCQRIKHDLDQERIAAAQAAAPTPRQRMNEWLDQLPDK